MTIKTIKAALAEHAPGAWDDLYCRAWLAWCVEQIERWDALLRRFTQECSYRQGLLPGECVCRLCAEARKVMEESE